MPAAERVRRTILIAGSGYTGRRLADRLAAGADSVIALRRGGTPDAAGRGGIQPVRCDLDDPEDRRRLAERLAEIEGPIRIAYLVPPKPIAAGADPQSSDDARLAAFLDAVSDSGASVARLVLASTSGVYGDCGGATVSEDTPVNPRTDRARARVAAEATATRWSDENGASLCILRIAGIYGPGRLPVRQIRSKQPIIHPDEAGPGNRIHVDDLVEAFVRALDQPDPPRLVNVCDGDHLSSSGFYLAVAAAAGLPPPPLVSRSRAQSTFGEARLSFLNESRQLDATRLTRDLAVRLRYPDATLGIRASLNEEGDQG